MTTKKDWKDVDGFLTIDEGNKLMELSKDKISLEIGCYYGRSTLALAKLGKLVFTIDTFSVKDKNLYPKKVTNFEHMRKFLDNKAHYENIVTIIGFSSIISYIIKPLSIDVLFIDGNHRYDSIKSDVELYWNFLKSDGILICHDYVNNNVGRDVKKYLDSVFIRPDELIDTLAIYKKEKYLEIKF